MCLYYPNSGMFGDNHQSQNAAEEHVKLGGVVSNTLDIYGRIDILVNVVGDYLGGKTVAELEEKE